MPLRFYKRLRAGPFRLNLSKRGISTSIGTKGAWLTFGRNRIRTTIGLPGSGLYWTEQRRLSRQHTAAPPANDTGKGTAGTLQRALWIIGAIIVVGVTCALDVLTRH